MVRKLSRKRTRRFRIGTRRKRHQKGGKETSGYFLALDGFPNAPGASRVDSYSSCNAPVVKLPLDSAFLKSSGLSSGQVGGKRKRRKNRRTRKNRRRNRRKTSRITRSRKY